MVCYAAEISAPPVEVVVLLVGGFVVTVLLGIDRIALDTFDHNEQVRVFVKNCKTGLFSNVLPVVRILGIIPLCARIFIRLSVRFVFKVDGDDSIVILISGSNPFESSYVVLFGDLVVAP